MHKDELLELAASVAAHLRHDHGIDSVPDAAQYAFEDASINGKARLLVDVDLGKGLVIPLEGAPAGIAAAGSNTAPLPMRLAKLIAYLHGKTTELSATRRMIERRIAKVNATGVHCMFLSATPIEMDVDWCTGPFIEFFFEAIDDSLRVATEHFIVTNRKQTKEYFDDFDRGQARKAAHRARMARYGADASIDAVLLNALRSAGVEDADLLRTLHGSRDRDVSIVSANGTEFKASWSDGTLKGRVPLGDGVSWYDGSLFLDPAPRSFGEKDVGRRLVDIYSHDLLEDGMLVKRAFGKKGRPAQFICNWFIHALNLEEERYIEAP
jgi:hypothetical protein